MVWNDGVTMYPSPLVKSYTGILQDTNFKNFDPLLAFVEHSGGFGGEAVTNTQPGASGGFVQQLQQLPPSQQGPVQ